MFEHGKKKKHNKKKREKTKTKTERISIGRSDLTLIFWRVVPLSEIRCIGPHQP
jgi:hypothetical protein